MLIEFATCDRQQGLRYLQKVYPSAVIEDTPDSAGPLLDLVAQDLCRIQDPMMYGNRIAIVPGKKFSEADRERLTDTAAEFDRRATLSGRKSDDD